MTYANGSIRLIRRRNVASLSQESSWLAACLVWLSWSSLLGFSNMNTVYCVVTVKGPERYFFVYNDAHIIDVLRTMGRYAANPELSYTWYDAAVASQHVRCLHKEGLHNT